MRGYRTTLQRNGFGRPQRVGLNAPNALHPELAGWLRTGDSCRREKDPRRKEPSERRGWWEGSPFRAGARGIREVYARGLGEAILRRHQRSYLFRHKGHALTSTRTLFILCSFFDDTGSALPEIFALAWVFIALVIGEVGLNLLRCLRWFTLGFDYAGNGFGPSTGCAGPFVNLRFF